MRMKLKYITGIIPYIGKYWKIPYIVVLNLLECSPCSPDLALCDFALFPHVKMKMKRWFFSGLYD